MPDHRLQPLTAHIHWLPPYAATDRPALGLITGRHEIADQGRAQGVGGFFRKPFDAQALLAAIANALHKSTDGG